MAAALEFGLPNALLFPPSEMENAQDAVQQVASTDAFMPTGLLLSEPASNAEFANVSSSPMEGGFGGEWSH